MQPHCTPERAIILCSGQSFHPNSWGCCYGQIMMSPSILWINWLFISSPTSCATFFREIFSRLLLCIHSSSLQSCTVRDIVVFLKCLICQSQLNILSMGRECGIGVILKIWCGGSFLQIYSWSINLNTSATRPFLHRDAMWTNDTARLPTQCKMRAQGYMVISP